MTLKIYILFIFFFIQNLTLLAINPEIEKLVKEVKHADDNFKKCNNLNKIASFYYNKKSKEAISYANKALHLSLKLNYNKGIAQSYLTKAKINERLNNYNIAVENYFSSLMIQEQLENEEETATIFYRLGRINKTIGNYSLALEYCLNSLRIRNHLNDQLGKSDVFNTIGSIYKYIE